MAADPLICEILAEEHSLEQLKVLRRDTLDEIQALESLTSTSLDGTSKTFDPREVHRLRHNLENYQCAIKRHERGADNVIQTTGRRIHFNRPCE